ncbi:MAG: starch-binding protein [Ruminococcus bromii]|nr:starch-binding protein [Ruminococcus bromii]MDY4977734.1 starch-binding protein [Ruminococcus bromii]
MKLGKKLCRTVKKSFSLVLALTIMLSVCAVSGINVSKVSAAESKTLYYMNTGGWGSVYAYTWTMVSDKATKYTGDWPGTAMDKVQNVKQNVYKITVDANAENIIFNSGNGAQTGTIEIPSSSNMIYNNGSWSEYSETVVEDNFEYDAKIDSSFPDSMYLASCSYYDYLDDQELSTQWGNVKTAGNSATWYPFDNFNSYLSQYYEDNNVKKPLYYGNFNTGTASETVRKDTYNAKKGSLYGYDAAANNSKAVWHDIKTTNIDVNNTDDLAGCSSPDSWSWSYQGIVSKDLSSDGNLMMMKNDNSGTVAAPFFSDSFLSKTGSGQNSSYGKKVNAALPFTYDSNTKKYSYQSSTVSSHANPVNSIYLKNANTGSSTNNLNGVTSDSLTLMYGGSDTSKAIPDGKLWFNSGESGYGFLPFNNNTINHTGEDVRNDLNYGFGMALSVDFTVPKDGKIDDQDVTFTFTGDDDVWIYIDGKLVVDLGGDHKDASCTLNFANNSTTYATGLNSKSVTSASSVYSLTDVMKGSTKNTVHKLQMFYMERGLIESNLQVEFSFTPVDNKLTTTKTVNTVNVNDGIKDAVAAADSFTFTNVNNGSGNTDHSPLGSKEYFLTEKSGSTSSPVSGTDGSYSMKNGSSAVFTNITDVGNWLTVSESMNDSFIKYSSSTYSVTDVNNGIQKGSGSGTSANFLFKNEVNEKHATDYKVDFVNTPQLSNLDVSKSAFDKDSNPITNVSYNFTVYLSFDGGTTYNQYPLDYTINGAEYTADNGTFALRGGETAVFPNIPVGTKYKIVEKANSDYTVTSTGETGTVNDSGAVARFVNREIDKTDVHVTLNAAKTLDGTAPDVNTFLFTLTEMVKDGSTLTESKLLQEKNNFGGKVTFDSIAYEYREAPTDSVTQPTTAAPSTTRFLAKAKTQTAEPVEANGGAGVNASATVDKFYYQIAEKNLGGDTYTYDTAKYYAVVSVDRSTAPNTATVKYYPTAKDAIDETNEIANPTENVKFNNYHKGSIEISKSGADGSTFQNMAGQVEFSLYKLDSPSDELTSNNLVETKAIDNNGIVKFEDLLIFKGQNTNDTGEHQLYCFVETKAAPGYNISSEKHFFTVPYAQQCESGEASDFTIGGVGFKYLADSDGELIYHIKAGTVTNYPLTMPSASGDGMNGYFVLGVSVAGLAVTMFTGYAIYYGKGRKKRRARRRK